MAISIIAPWVGSVEELPGVPFVPSSLEFRVLLGNALCSSEVFSLCSSSVLRFVRSLWEAPLFVGGPWLVLSGVSLASIPSVRLIETSRCRL
eukprot:IDg7760t1